MNGRHLIARCALLVACSACLSRAGIHDGLVFHYSFDVPDADFVADDSGNGVTAAVHGATHTSEGIIGGAYSFDGINDYIRLPEGFQNGVTSHTVTAWINMADLRLSPFQSEARVIISGWETPRQTGGINTYLSKTGGAIATVVHSYEYPGSGSYAFRPADVFAPDDSNKWFFVAVTCRQEGGTVETAVYLDGSVVGSESKTALPMNYGGQHGYIGVNEAGYAVGGSYLREFYGLMDEVRLYNRALAPEEVEQLYLLAFAPVDVVDLKANGSDDLVVLAPGEMLTLTADLVADPAIAGDTWILAVTPLNFPFTIFSYDVGSGFWFPWLFTFNSPSAQGPIPALESTVLFQADGLPGGFYTFYLGYDPTRNRKIDFAELEIDAVSVIIGD